MKDFSKEKNKLQQDYLEIFERVESYADFSGLEPMDVVDALDNLMDMLLQAQAEGKPVSYLVGGDLEQFCKNYFEDTSIPTEGKRSKDCNKAIQSVCVLYRNRIYC